MASSKSKSPNRAKVKMTGENVFGDNYSFTEQPGIIPARQHLMFNTTKLRDKTVSELSKNRKNEMKDAADARNPDSSQPCKTTRNDTRKEPATKTETENKSSRNKSPKVYTSPIRITQSVRNRSKSPTRSKTPKPKSNPQKHNQPTSEKANDDKYSVEKPKSAIRGRRDAADSSIVCQKFAGVEYENVRSVYQRDDSEQTNVLRENRTRSKSKECSENKHIGNLSDVLPVHDIQHVYMNSNTTEKESCSSITKAMRDAPKQNPSCDPPESKYHENIKHSPNERETRNTFQDCMENSEEICLNLPSLDPNIVYPSENYRPENNITELLYTDINAKKDTSKKRSRNENHLENIKRLYPKLKVKKQSSKCKKIKSNTKKNQDEDGDDSYTKLLNALNSLNQDKQPIENRDEPNESPTIDQIKIDEQDDQNDEEIVVYDNEHFTKYEKAGCDYNDDESIDNCRMYPDPEIRFRAPRRRCEGHEINNDLEARYQDPERRYDVGRRYEDPRWGFEVRERRYELPERRYDVPERRYENPVRRYVVQESYEDPEGRYAVPERHGDPEGRRAVLKRRPDDPRQRYQSRERRYEDPEMYGEVSRRVNSAYSDRTYQPSRYEDNSNYKQFQRQHEDVRCRYDSSDRNRNRFIKKTKSDVSDISCASNLEDRAGYDDPRRYYNPERRYKEPARREDTRRPQNDPSPCQTVRRFDSRRRFERDRSTDSVRNFEERRKYDSSSEESYECGPEPKPNHAEDLSKKNRNDSKQRAEPCKLRRDARVKKSTSELSQLRKKPELTLKPQKKCDEPLNKYQLVLKKYEEKPKKSESPIGSMRLAKKDEDAAKKNEDILKKYKNKPNRSDDTSKKAADILNKSKKCEDTLKNYIDKSNKSVDKSIKSGDRSKNDEPISKKSEDIIKKYEKTNKCEDRLKKTDDTLKKYETRPSTYEDRSKKGEDILSKYEDRPKTHEERPYKYKNISKKSNDILRKYEDRSKYENTAKKCEDRLKPCENILKKYEFRPNKSEDRPKKCEDILKKYEDRSKKCEDRSKPCEDRSKPCEDRSKPSESILMKYVERPNKSEDKPKKCEDRPKKCEDVLKKYEDRPKKCEDALKKYEDRPKKCEDRPKKCEDILKKYEDRPKKCEDRPKKCEDILKKYEDRPKKCEDILKKYEDRPKKCEDILKKYEDRPRTCEDILKKYEDKSKRDEDILNKYETRSIRCADKPNRYEDRSKTEKSQLDGTSKKCEDILKKYEDRSKKSDVAAAKLDKPSRKHDDTSRRYERILKQYEDRSKTCDDKSQKIDMNKYDNALRVYEDTLRVYEDRSKKCEETTRKCEDVLKKYEVPCRPRRHEDVARKTDGLTTRYGYTGRKHDYEYSPKLNKSVELSKKCEEIVRKIPHVSRPISVNTELTNIKSCASVKNASYIPRPITKKHDAYKSRSSSKKSDDASPIPRRDTGRCFDTMKSRTDTSNLRRIECIEDPCRTSGSVLMKFEDLECNSAGNREIQTGYGPCLFRAPSRKLDVSCTSLRKHRLSSNRSVDFLHKRSSLKKSRDSSLTELPSSRKSSLSPKRPGHYEDVLRQCEEALKKHQEKSPKKDASKKKNRKKSGDLETPKDSKTSTKKKDKSETSGKKSKTSMKQSEDDLQTSRFSDGFTKNDMETCRKLYPDVAEKKSKSSLEKKDSSMKQIDEDKCYEMYRQSRYAQPEVSKKKSKSSMKQPKDKDRKKEKSKTSKTSLKPNEDDVCWQAYRKLYCSELQPKKSDTSTKNSPSSGVSLTQDEEDKALEMYRKCEEDKALEMYRKCEEEMYRKCEEEMYRKLCRDFAEASKGPVKKKNSESSLKQTEQDKGSEVSRKSSDDNQDVPQKKSKTPKKDKDAKKQKDKARKKDKTSKTSLKKQKEEKDRRKEKSSKTSLKRQKEQERKKDKVSKTSSKQSKEEKRRAKKETSKKSKSDEQSQASASIKSCESHESPSEGKKSPKSRPTEDDIDKSQKKARKKKSNSSVSSEKQHEQPKEGKAREKNEDPNAAAKNPKKTDCSSDDGSNSTRYANLIMKYETMFAPWRNKTNGDPCRDNDSLKLENISKKLTNITNTISSECKDVSDRCFKKVEYKCDDAKIPKFIDQSTHTCREASTSSGYHRRDRRVSSSCSLEEMTRRRDFQSQYMEDPPPSNDFQTQCGRPKKHSIQFGEKPTTNEQKDEESRSTPNDDENDQTNKKKTKKKNKPPKKKKSKQKIPKDEKKKNKRSKPETKSSSSKSSMDASSKPSETSMKPANPPTNHDPKHDNTPTKQHGKTENPPNHPECPPTTTDCPTTNQKKPDSAPTRSPTKRQYDSMSYCSSPMGCYDATSNCYVSSTRYDTRSFNGPIKPYYSSAKSDDSSKKCDESTKCHDQPPVRGDLPTNNDVSPNDPEPSTNRDDPCTESATKHDITTLEYTDSDYKKLKKRVMDVRKKFEKTEKNLDCFLKSHQGQYESLQKPYQQRAPDRPKVYPNKLLNEDHERIEDRRRHKTGGEDPYEDYISVAIPRQEDHAKIYLVSNRRCDEPKCVVRRRRDSTEQPVNHRRRYERRMIDPKRDAGRNDDSTERYLPMSEYISFLNHQKNNFAEDAPQDSTASDAVDGKPSENLNEVSSNENPVYYLPITSRMMRNPKIDKSRSVSFYCGNLRAGANFTDDHYCRPSTGGTKRRAGYYQEMRRSFSDASFTGHCLKENKRRRSYDRRRSLDERKFTDRSDSLKPSGAKSTQKQTPELIRPNDKQPKKDKARSRSSDQYEHYLVYGAKPCDYIDISDLFKTTLNETKPDEDKRRYKSKDRPTAEKKTKNRRSEYKPENASTDRKSLGGSPDGSPDSRSLERKSPDRKSPDRRSPDRRSPDRRSPDRRSPDRRSPDRRSPSRRSPDRRSPGRRSPDRSPDRRSPDKIYLERSPERRSLGRKSLEKRRIEMSLERILKDGRSRDDRKKDERSGPYKERFNEDAFEERRHKDAPKDEHKDKYRYLKERMRSREGSLEQGTERLVRFTNFEDRNEDAPGRHREERPKDAKRREKIDEETVREEKCIVDLRKYLQEMLKGRYTAGKGIEERHSGETYRSRRGSYLEERLPRGRHKEGHSDERNKEERTGEERSKGSYCDEKPKEDRLGEDSPKGSWYKEESPGEETPKGSWYKEERPGEETPKGSWYKEERPGEESPRGSGYNEERPGEDSPRGSGYKEERSGEESPKGSLKYKEERLNDESPKGSRYKEERLSDESPKGSRYKEERLSDETPKGSRYKEERLSDESPKGSRYKEERYSDGKSEESEEKPEEKSLEDRLIEERMKIINKYKKIDFPDERPKKGNEDGPVEERYKEGRYLDETREVVSITNHVLVSYNRFKDERPKDDLDIMSKYKKYLDERLDEETRYRDEDGPNKYGRRNSDESKEAGPDEERSKYKDSDETSQAERSNEDGREERSNEDETEEKSNDNEERSTEERSTEDANEERSTEDEERSKNARPECDVTRQGVSIIKSIRYRTSLDKIRPDDYDEPFETIRTIDTKSFSKHNKSTETSDIIRTVGYNTNKSTEIEANEIEVNPFATLRKITPDAMLETMIEEIRPEELTEKIRPEAVMEKIRSNDKKTRPDDVKIRPDDMKIRPDDVKIRRNDMKIRPDVNDAEAISIIARYSNVLRWSDRDAEQGGSNQEKIRPKTVFDGYDYCEPMRKESTETTEVTNRSVSRVDDILIVTDRNLKKSSSFILEEVTTDTESPKRNSISNEKSPSKDYLTVRFKESVESMNSFNKKDKQNKSTKSPTQGIMKAKSTQRISLGHGSELNIDLDLVEKTVREENDFIEKTLFLIRSKNLSSERHGANTSREKARSVRIIEKALEQNVPYSEEGEEIQADVIALLMKQVEYGFVNSYCSKPSRSIIKLMQKNKRSLRDTENYNKYFDNKSSGDTNIDSGDPKRDLEADIPVSDDFDEHMQHILYCQEKNESKGPQHFSKVQLKGSTLPTWFPGYFSAFVNCKGLDVEKRPSCIFKKAWSTFSPDEVVKNSEVIIV